MTAENPVDERLAYSLPRERVHLLMLERNWPPVPTPSIAPSDAGFAAIQIDEDRCTLCGWCAGFCPMAALEWSREGNSLRLIFQPLSCIDCHICTAACPVEAVHKMDEFPVDYLRDRLLLAEGRSVACETCGKLTALDRGKQCLWCAQAKRDTTTHLDIPWDTFFHDTPEQ